MASATMTNGSYNGIDTREKLTRLSESEWEGVRFFFADTDDVTKAMLASGLPAIDDPWDPVNLPDLKVTRVGPPAGAWGCEGASGMSGTILIPVQYKTPGIKILPYDVGDAWTETECGQSSVQVATGLIYDDGKGDFVPDTMLPAINGGNGFQKVVGVVQARVVKVYSELDYHDKRNTWAQYGTEAAFNAYDFSLPPIRDGTIEHLISAGMAQYFGYREEMVGKGKVRVTHSFNLFGKNIYAWPETAEDGMVLKMWEPHPWTIRDFSTML